MALIKIKFTMSPAPRHSKKEWATFICYDYPPHKFIGYEAALIYEVAYHADDKAAYDAGWKKGGSGSAKKLWVKHKASMVHYFLDSLGTRCRTITASPTEYFSVDPDTQKTKRDQHSASWKPWGVPKCDDLCRQVGYVQGELSVTYMKPQGGGDDQEYTGDTSEDGEGTARQSYYGEAGPTSHTDAAGTMTATSPLPGTTDADRNAAGSATPHDVPGSSKKYDTLKYEYAYQIEHCKKVGSGATEYAKPVPADGSDITADPPEDTYRKKFKIPDGVGPKGRIKNGTDKDWTTLASLGPSRSSGRALVAGQAGFLMVGRRWMVSPAPMAGALRGVEPLPRGQILRPLPFLRGE